MLRRFMPKYGSGTILPAAWAASTVLGTEVLSQSSATNEGAEMAAPSAFSVQADCRRQPSCNGVTVAANAALVSPNGARRQAIVLGRIDNSSGVSGVSNPAGKATISNV